MRSVFIVLLAATLIASGTCVMLLQLNASLVMYRFLVSGIFAIGFGLYLLWNEFRPMTGQRRNAEGKKPRRMM
jgi:hypothetical protein